MEIAVKKVFSNDTVKFVAGFLLLYGGLYSVNYVFTGLTIPGGRYSPFLDRHLDYITGLRNLVLEGASYILSWMGYDSYVYTNLLYVRGANTVRMVYSCIGLNIICLWWAFIITFPQPAVKKLVYFLAGPVIITLLNMVRVTFVSLAPRKPVLFNIPIDHHDLFNFIVYGIIILFIFRIINKNTRNIAG